MKNQRKIFAFVVCGVLLRSMACAASGDNANAVNVPVVPRANSTVLPKPPAAVAAGGHGFVHPNISAKMPVHGAAQPVISGQNVSKINTTASVTGTGLKRKP